jgi:hypothetical protein
MLTFTFFFLLLNLALRFWGQRLLKVVRVQVEPNNLTLPLAAGLAFLVFLALSFSSFINNYNVFFLLFYLIGLIGAFYSIFFIIKNLIHNNNRKAALIDLLKCDSFIVLILLSIVLSFIHSAVWPSGNLEIYFNYNYDYFSWIFATEYLVDGINPQTLDLNPFFYEIITDAFGTYIIMGVIATANLKTPLLASPIISLTLLVWAAEALYCLLRQTFGLRPWLTLILTLGVAVGSLFNYVAVIGMFGHMIFLITFLISFEQLSHNSNPNINIIQSKRRLFFPLIILFISYQAGYIILACFVALFGALIFFFQRQNQPFFSRLTYSAILGFWPVALVTIVSSLLAPGIFVHLSQRFLQVAAQTAGWGLPFFSPWHFSGLPYYSPKAFQPVISPVFWRDLLAYIPLIILTSIFLFLILKKNKIKKPDLSNLNNKPISRAGVITALSITYLIALGTFLTLSLYFGTYYKIWKFAAYAVLPLSFVPTALFFKSLEDWRPRRPLTLISLTVLIAFISFKFISMPPFVEIPNKYFMMISGSTFINGEQVIQSKLPDSSSIFIDFDFYDELFVSSFIFNSNKFNKMHYLAPFIFTNNYILDFNIIDYNIFIVSDTKYNNLIKGAPNASDSGLIFTYDYNTIFNQGMVFFTNGITPYDWEISSYPIHASFLIPKAKIGQELKLSIDLAAPDTPICRTKARLGVVHKDIIVWEDKEIDQVSTTVPAELTDRGVVYAHLIVPQPLGTEASCLYKINRFTLD